MESSHCNMSYNTLIKQTVIAAIVAISLFIGAILHVIPEPNTTTGYLINWLDAIVTLGILVYSGRHFFNKNSSPNILIAMATGITWLYSVLVLIFISHLPLIEQHTYFEITIVIITLANLELIFEQRIRRNANGFKFELADTVNKVAAVFVPLVITIAIFTALLWYYIGKEPVAVYMLITSISVLVIGCPYALRLAVPVSAMVGIDKAAQAGILIRDANTLQTTCNINTVVLDKTGIITLGKPRLTDIMVIHGIDPNQVLSIAASLESGSQHPYALAILAAAKEKSLTVAAVSDFQNFAGLGINGIIAGQPACIGNKGFMEAQLVKIDTLKDQAKSFAKIGATALYVAHNKQLIGLLTLVDPIKPDAKFLVQKLHDMQIHVIMATGDQQITADAIAEHVGITEVVADVMPQEKANKIAVMQQEGAVVAMVGNGINAAPALAQSDVGFTINSNINSTQQTTDITLINDSLNNIVETIYISRATVKNMQQNLYGVAIYNIVGIPIAAGVLFPFTGFLLNPMLAAAIMTFSSIFVISNANRLRFLHS